MPDRRIVFRLAAKWPNLRHDATIGDQARCRGVQLTVNGRASLKIHNNLIGPANHCDNIGDITEPSPALRVESDGADGSWAAGKPPCDKHARLGPRPIIRIRGGIL